MEITPIVWLLAGAVFLGAVEKYIKPGRAMIKPEFPISKCLGANKVPSSTRAMVVSLTDAVNHPIKLTRPSVDVVNWRSMGSGGSSHDVCPPFQLLPALPGALSMYSVPAARRHVGIAR